MKLNRKPLSFLPLIACLLVIGLAFWLHADGGAPEAWGGQDLLARTLAPAAAFARFALIPSVLALFVPRRALHAWLALSLAAAAIATLLVPLHPPYLYGGFGILGGSSTREAFAGALGAACAVLGVIAFAALAGRERRGR
jgi:hypothetical protein